MGKPTPKHSLTDAPAAVQYAYRFPAIDDRGAFTVTVMAHVSTPPEALDGEIRDALAEAGYTPPTRLPRPERRDVPAWEFDFGKEPNGTRP